MAIFLTNVEAPPGFEQGWRFCRQGRIVYLVGSSCFLVGPAPPFFHGVRAQLFPSCSHVRRLELPAAGNSSSCRSTTGQPRRRGASGLFLPIADLLALLAAGGSNVAQLMVRNVDAAVVRE